LLFRGGIESECRARSSRPALLDRVKVGDKVRFVAANPGGKLTVTEIQPAK
jgi:Cu/Ag efflux protein CusF